MLVGYTVEILPYNIRAKGLTVMFLMVDIVSGILGSIPFYLHIRL